MARQSGWTSGAAANRIERDVKSKRASGLHPGCWSLLAGAGLLVLLANQLSFGQQNPPPASPTGEAIFAAHCAKCHGDRGEGLSAVATILGPSLQAEHDPGEVMAAVEVGPSHMPRFSYVLSVEQMHQVADYVTQKLAVIPLDSVPADVGKGGDDFRIYCAPCHRTAVRGGALAFVGTNAPPLVDESPAIIAGAIRWGPGPMPSFPPGVLDDKQVASIVAYIQTVQHPPNPGGNTLNWYGPVPEGFAAWVIVLSLVVATMWIEKGGRG